MTATDPQTELPIDLPPAPEIADESRGFFSGLLLRERAPRLYRAIVHLRGRDMPLREIAQILGVSVNSVMAVERSEGAAIETIKHSLSRDFVSVAQLAAQTARDRLVSDPDKTSFKDLMIGAAVATDKALLLAGEATSRIAYMPAPPDDDDYSRWIRTAGRVIDAECVDTGIEGAAAGQRGPAAGPGLARIGLGGAAGDVASGSAQVVPVDGGSTVVAAITPDSCGSAGGGVRDGASVATGAGVHGRAVDGAGGRVPAPAEAIADGGGGGSARRLGPG